MREGFLEDLISASGGEIVGRTRLQKMVYLLSELGACSDFAFEYHHYGPFSDDLATEVEYSKIVSRTIFEDQKERAIDGAKYSVFRCANLRRPESVGDLKASEAMPIINRLRDQNSTVLELAATIHWLIHKEHVEDWEKELEIRKGAKTKAGRAQKAKVLLNELGL